MSTVEELTKALEEKTAITEALKEKVALLEALVAKREERLAAVLEAGDASAIPEGIPGTSADLDRTASVAKYTGLLNQPDLSEADRRVVQRVRALREGGTSVTDFSAEDFAAWQQLNTQWREIQQSDEIIAVTVAELDEEEQIRPGLSEDAAEVATEGLCRQVSVAKYDQMLQNPTLAEDKRAQVLAMREKRLTRELGSFTEEERAEWEYLQQLSQQMAATDESIAQVLSEPTAAQRAAEVDAEPGDVERSLLSAGVDHSLLEEHERAAEELAAQEADAAIAAVVEVESAADSAANTEEVQDMPWEPIDGITPEMITEHEEQVARRIETDATFTVDSTMVAAENAEADFELAAKQAGSSAQDPSVKPGYSQSDGGAVPEPEGNDSLLVVATAVDTATEIEADILPMDELIGVTARAAGIDEGGLRDYIESAKAATAIPSADGGLLRTTSRDLGVPEEELRKLVAKYSSRLAGADVGSSTAVAPDEPEPEPEPLA